MDRPCICDKPDCRICYLYHNDPRYRKLWGGPPLAEEPGILKKAWTFTKATAHHIAKGLPTVSKEVFRKRIAICESCPQFTEARGCQLCGCSMDLKATWAEQECPIKKWLAEVKK